MFYDWLSRVRTRVACRLVELPFTIQSRRASQPKFGLSKPSTYFAISADERDILYVETNMMVLSAARQL